MKPIVCVLLAAFTVSGCKAAAEGRAPAAPGDILISAQLGMAKIAARDGNLDMVLSSLTPAMSDELWPKLSPPVQYEVAELYGQAADAQEHWGMAHRGFMRASALPQATNEDWDQRMHAAIVTGDAADAYLAFEHLRGRHIGVLQTFAGRQIQRFDALLGDLPNAGQARLALGRQMEAENWAPVFAFYDPSLVWAHYVEALLETGDMAHARVAAMRITDPTVMIAMASDRRFDALVAATPQLRDPQAAAERYLAWAQDNARTNPRMLSARIAVVRALTVLDRPQEALDYAQATVRAMAHGTHTDPAFDDMGQSATFEGWRSSLLVRLGRGEEAVAGLTTASSCHCSAISAVELGQALMRLGRAKEAQDWLDDADAERLGVQDLMDLEVARACTAAQLGDANRVGRSLEFLRKHAAWSPDAPVEALVCANRLDEAAGELQTQLNDPSRRLEALRGAQVYADPDHQPFTEQVRGRWAALLARPDVRQAIDKVGRSARFALQARDSLA